MTVEADIEAIVHRDLADPHRLLGAHPQNGGVVVRAFRPAAAKVLARVEGSKKPVELAQRHPAGLFEGEVAGATLPLRYELEVVRRERWYVRAISTDPRATTTRRSP